MECWPSPNTYYSPSLLEVVSGRVVLVLLWVSVEVCREVDCSTYCMTVNLKIADSSWRAMC